MDYHRIGEVFDYQGFKLEVKKAVNRRACGKCFFNFGDCRHVPCMSPKREDRTSVYFRKVGESDESGFDMSKTWISEKGQP